MKIDGNTASAHYRPDIDGLRAFAVIAVLIFHAFPEFAPGGFVGVDVFFVISGYLIASITLKQVDNGHFNIWHYFTRRIRRLFPAMGIILLATIAIGGAVLLSHEYAKLGHHVIYSTLFFTNYLLWNQAGYFDTDTYTKPLLHLWSLAVEGQFYLLWAIALIALKRLRKCRSLAIGVIACISFAFNIILTERDPTLAFYFTISRFWEFLLGAGLAAINQQTDAVNTLCLRALSQISPRQKVALKNASSLVGLGLIFCSIAFLNKQSSFPGWNALFPATGALAILAAGPEAWINQKILSNRLAVAIGLLSYSLYLWHWPLLSFVYIVELSGAMLFGTKIVVLILSGVAAVLTYHFVEVRFHKGLKGTAVSPWLFAGLIAVALSGYAVEAYALSRGNEQIDQIRWPKELNQSQGCADKYAVVEGEDYCRESNAEAEAMIIVIGDSHANALAAGVIGEESSSNVLNLGGGGTSFLRDTILDWGSEGDRSIRVTEHIYGVIEEHRPPKVVVTSMLGYYFSGEHFGSVGRGVPRVSFTSIHHPNQSPEAFFGEVLTRDLTWLLQHTDQVLFVLDVPELGFNPVNCIRPFRQGWLGTQLQLNNGCSVSRSQVEERQSAYREIAWKVGRDIGSPNLKILDPLSVLCDGEFCYAMKDGLMLYRDHNHLSEKGSRYVWSRLMADLRAKGN